MIYRFTEVLNDLVNYFLLGDILLLEDWKQANHLSDDLAMEFTTNESGDRIFAEGIVIPMTGIENYPYTILFNLSGDRPELCKERNRLQLRKSGYSLKVDHNMLMLFTWPILEQFTPEKVKDLISYYFYAEKYLNTLRVGAETEADELFDKSHGFYIAVIQGFFRDYYYTRGSAFSFLVEQKPEYARYFTSWEQITPVSFPNPMQNRIIENYCSGVYLSPDQVIQLLKDMEQDPKVLDDLEGLWSNGQIAVLKKALSAAAKSGVGLLEATEVVEPNPISPNESTSYSNLYHCDRDGVYLYIDAVSGQLADAIGKNEG